MCLECALPAARWMSKVKGWPPRNPTCFIIEGGHPVKFLCTWSWLYMWPPLLNVNISKWEGSACAFSGAGTLLPPALSLSSDGWGGATLPRAREPRRQRGYSWGHGPEPVTSAYWCGRGSSQALRSQPDESKCSLGTGGSFFHVKGDSGWAWRSHALNIQTQSGRGCTHFSSLTDFPKGFIHRWEESCETAKQNRIFFLIYFILFYFF